MKHRARKVIAISTALLLGGLVYAWITTVTGFGIPCLFYTITKLQCPGCGVSRMFLCLLRLDIGGAFRANPVILILLPVLTAIAVDIIQRYIKIGQFRSKGWSTAAVWGCIIILILFGIIRNIF